MVHSETRPTSRNQSADNYKLFKTGHFHFLSYICVLKGYNYILVLSLQRVKLKLKPSVKQHMFNSTFLHYNHTWLQRLHNLTDILQAS